MGKESVGNPGGKETAQEANAVQLGQLPREEGFADPGFGLVGRKFPEVQPTD